MKTEPEKYLDFGDVVANLHSELVKTAHEAIEEVNEAYEPYWKTKIDLAKTIVSLASGALILTLTFGDKLLQGVTVTDWWRYCLPAAWIALVISAAMGSISLWAGLSFKRARWLMHYDKDELYSEYDLRNSLEKRLSSEPNTNEAIRKVLKDVELQPNWVSSIKWQNGIALYSLWASYGFFVLAITALAVVGWQIFAT